MKKGKKRKEKVWKEVKLGKERKREGNEKRPETIF